MSCNDCKYECDVYIIFHVKVLNWLHGHLIDLLKYLEIFTEINMITDKSKVPLICDTSYFLLMVNRV